jgi:hypothetical protein
MKVCLIRRCKSSENYNREINENVLYHTVVSYQLPG